MFAAWKWTVRGETKSRSAISGALRPSARAARISFSRRVRRTAPGSVSIPLFLLVVLLLVRCVSLAALVSGYTIVFCLHPPAVWVLPGTFCIRKDAGQL